MKQDTCRIVTLMFANTITVTESLPQTILLGDYRNNVYKVSVHSVILNITITVIAQPQPLPLPSTPPQLVVSLIIAWISLSLHSLSRV